MTQPAVRPGGHGPATDGGRCQGFVHTLTQGWVWIEERPGGSFITYA